MASRLSPKPIRRSSKQHPIPSRSPLKRKTAITSVLYVSGAEEDVASGDAVGYGIRQRPSLRSVRREIYFSCKNGSVQAQQNQLALWSNLAIWFFGMMIMMCLYCLCLPMCAIERDRKRSQSTQTNQSNQLFHNLSLQVFVNVYSLNMIYDLLLFE
jgi:hypothetical protein